MADASPSARRYRRLQRIGAVAGFGLALSGVAATYLYTQMNRPLRLNGPETLQIDQGEHLPQIVRNLRGRHIVDNWAQATGIRLYARVMGMARMIRAGEYQLKPGETPMRMLRQLVSGSVLLHELTLVDGWRFRQAWHVIRKDPDLRHTLPPNAGDKSIMAAIGHPDVPAEGRFFPDTYRFPKAETDVTLLRQAYREMQIRLQEVWAHRSEDLPLKTPTDALILASLIEKETALPSERPKVAGVFIRRLEIGMRLQSDPSVIYGLGKSYDGKLHVKDLKLETPYNTYMRSGLPPTPICLPGEGSLQAAVHPAASKALYFVSKGNGSHAFSDTLSQQDANVRRYELDKRK